MVALNVEFMSSNYLGLIWCHLGWTRVTCILYIYVVVVDVSFSFFFPFIFFSEQSTIYV